MSYLDRILIVILSLASMVGAVILFLLGLGVLAGGQDLSVLSTYPGNIYALVGAVIWFLLGLRFLFYRISRPEADHVVLPGEYGNIRISFDTIRQLSNRKGRGVKGVQEFETRVRNGQAGVWLAVRVKALPDVDLGLMSRELQADIKDYVEQTTGVAVERITVNIAELASTPSKAGKAWVN